MRKNTPRRKVRGALPKKRRIDVSQFLGKWVAINPKSYKVIGHGDSPDEALESAAQTRVTDPILYFVPSSDAFFVGAR